MAGIFQQGLESRASPEPGREGARCPLVLTTQQPCPPVRTPRRRAASGTSWGHLPPPPLLRLPRGPAQAAKAGEPGQERGAVRSTIKLKNHKLCTGPPSQRPRPSDLPQLFQHLRQTTWLSPLSALRISTDQSLWAATTQAACQQGRCSLMLAHFTGTGPAPAALSSRECFSEAPFRLGQVLCLWPMIFYRG